MARRERNTLGIIRSAVQDPTARAVLGALSPADLRIVSQHWSEGTLKGHLDLILGADDPVAQAREQDTEIATVLRKVPATPMRALATVYRNSALICF